LTAPSLRIDISLVTNTTIETATVASKAGARWRAHVSAVFRACMPLVLCPLVAHAASFELAATLENPEGSEGSAFSGFFGAALATNGGSVVVTAPGNRFDPSAGERRGAIYQYDARTRARVRDFATPGFGRAFGVVIAVRGNLLAAAEIDGDYGVSDIARLFDLASGRLLRIIYRALSLVEVDASLVFTAGGRLVTGSPFADAAHVFDPATGEIRRTIMNPTNPVPEYGDLFGTHLAAAGRHILVGAPGDDTAGLDAGAAYLIDPETGGLVRTFLNPEPSETLASSRTPCSPSDRGSSSAPRVRSLRIVPPRLTSHACGSAAVAPCTFSMSGQETFSAPTRAPGSPMRNRSGRHLPAGARAS
jgi:hypothetical protein